MTEPTMISEHEECEATMFEGQGTNPMEHTCIEPKGHEGPHICLACSEQW